MKTLTSFRATTRNPAFKLLSRLMVIFGLAMMLAVSGWGTTHVDLSLTKSAPASVSAGTSLTYTLTASNVSTTAAPNVRVVDTLPTGVTYVSGDGAGWTCGASGQTVTCNMGSLAANPPAPDITIRTAVASTTTGSITNNATVSVTTSGYDDNHAGNDTATAVTAVQTPTAATTQDLCYDPETVTGFMLFSSVATPIRDVSGGALSDVTVVKSFNGITFGIGEQIGIDVANNKTIALDKDEAEVNSALSFGGITMSGMFGKGIVYRVGSYTANQSHTIYDYTMFSFNWANIALNAIYNKGGTYYSARINACPTPTLSIGNSTFSPEGNTTTTAMSFPIMLNTALTSATTVRYRFNDIDTNSSDTNVTNNSTYTFTLPINSSGTIQVPLVGIVGDTVIENNETFSITLLSATNGVTIDMAHNIGIGTIIDDDNTSGGGVTPPISSAYANVDVVNGYSGFGGTYHSWITTKVSAQPLVTLNAVYLGYDSANPVPQPYAPAGNLSQAASLTIIYKLADMSGGVTCANAPTVDLYQTDNSGNIVYSSGKPVPAAAVIAPTSSASPSIATSTPFTMQYLPAGLTAPLAKRDVRIKYKSVDFNTLINTSGVQCANKSSTGGVVEGIPACLITNAPDTSQAGANYKTVFGNTAFQNCYHANGQPCYSSNGGVGLPPYDSIYGCFECSIGNMPYTCSNDNFAIRPNYFNIGSTQSAFPNLLRSGEDYNLSVFAYDYGVTSGTNGSDGYTITGATSMYELNTTKYYINGTPASNTQMWGTPHWSAYDFNITDGVSWSSASVGSEVAGVQFDDVGKVNLQVRDKVWAAVDINNGYDTTPRDCSANGAWICGDKNVTYIPYNFDFQDLNITNNNGNPGSFTYIANEVGQMAGRIHTKMRALNKAGAVTQNFALNPLWENNVTVVPVVTKSTYLYPDANETNIMNLAIGFGTGTDANGTKTIVWNESNASKYLRFNFRRDINQTANPFDTNGTDLNISIISHYIDTTNGHFADINGSRLGTGINNLPYTVVSPALGSSKFVYGRIIPRDIRVFGAATPFTANGWYEVYNVPVINAISLPSSRNDALWYVNVPHSDTVNGDGDANVTVVITGANPTNATAIGGVETYSFNGGLALGGYKAHILTAPWLWYGVNALPYLDPNGPAQAGTDNLDCLTHPCFNINVVPPVGATGSAKSGAEGRKASKKSDSSGWRSTTDYAPAIR
ncbi:MAG: DUF11 domain-containing protein [Sulfuricurvum sp.]|nr:DUF11 domain-containing protein [Sulfuricurvum sp.]MDD5386050.1 DUF11 domain-containing protein [Sulfuricurvum sp.]